MLKSMIAAGGLSLLAGAALAHATLDQAEAPAGATARIALRVPHGCDGEATHTVRLSLPDGFYAAKPMPKAGWTLETVTGPYAEPYDSHGTEMTEGLREIVWSGGHLEDAWYDEFVVRGTIGPDLAAGTELFFPAVQTCATGTADWTDVSGEPGAANPAPSLIVTAAQAGGHGHGAAAESFDLGDLSLAGPFSRATLPNAPVAGGFVTVTNSGAEDDTLIGARSDVAGHMEIHEMAMEGDVMKMRELADGLPIPAGETVELKPGGYHVMFMELKQPLVEGETVDVTLEFAKAGGITLPFAVQAPNADGPGHHGMSH